MTKYTLSLPILTEVYELYEAVNYLKDSIPGITQHLADYMISPIGKGTEYQQREKLALVILFEEYIMETQGLERHEVFEKVFNNGKDITKEQRQQILINHYSIPEADLLTLLDRDEYLEILFERGELIKTEEINISLTASEVTMAIQLLDAILGIGKNISNINPKSDNPEVGIYHHLEDNEHSQLVHKFPNSDIKTLINKLQNK